MYYKNILFFLLFGLSNFLFEKNTHAATYNFYFNNTEQGANSTATPNMVVRDGKIVSSDKAAAKPEDEKTEEEVSQPMSDENTVSADTAISIRKKSKWRVSAGAVYLSYKTKERYSPYAALSDSYYYTSVSSDLQFRDYKASPIVASIGYDLTSNITLYGIVGRLLGGEVELRSPKLLGALSLSAIAGYVKDIVGFEKFVRHDYSWSGYAYSQDHYVNRVKPWIPMAGVRSNLSLARHFDLVGSARLGLVSKPEFKRLAKAFELSAQANF